MRTTRRGEAAGNSRGTPTAAAKSAIESGRRRTPVATADRPSATDRKSGITKKSPAWRRNWKKNDVNPACSRATLSMVGSIRTARPACRRRFSQSTNRVSRAAPPKMSQITGEAPSHCGAPGLGCTKPHVPERTTPKTIVASPAADKKVPTRSSLTPGTGGLSLIRRESTSDHQHHDHLAGEDPPPAEVGGAEPTDQRSDRDRDGGRRRHEPVGAGTIGRAEVGRH